MLEHDELLAGFIEDSQQHLQGLEPDLLALEQSVESVDPDVINRIFRSVHSIKGAAGFFGLQNISTLSHVMENLLSSVREGKTQPGSEMIDALLSGVDALKAMLADVSESDRYDIEKEIADIQGFLEATPPQRKVTVSEKDNGREAELGQFQVSESDVRELVRRGYYLYSIRIHLNADLRDQGKTPYDFINNMESLGRYVDAFLDLRGVSGLDDCLDNDLAFTFLFATILEPDLVPTGLELSQDRIRMIDLEGFKPQSPPSKPSPADAGERKPEEPGQTEKEMPKDSPAPDSEEAQSADEKARPPSDKGGRPVQTEEKIRVGVSFLNELVNLAGELVLGRNQLMQIGADLVKQTPGLNPVLQHVSRVTSELQEKIMLMRMQPISLIFSKFHRMVRSLAKNHAKEVRLLTEGDDVELDKTIIEGLSDPLTHLIRNSVDHGIEKPGEREKANKPRQGTLRIRAYHQGGQVHLEISDDGQGIDGDFIAKKAIEKGLVSRTQVNGMTEKEQVRLIFTPGFSTADKITDLRGRGVGMDVVSTNIEHLGGTVDVETRQGKGTKVTLILPLTLAIVSGLLVRAKEQLFILPEVDIDELVRVKPEEMAERINAVQDAWVLRLRDVLLPLVNLNQVLGLSGLEDTPAKLDADHPLRVLVIKQGESRFGLIVDSIVSTEEIVVKPLPRFLKKMKNFSGVSILGNGQVALILDVAGIVKKAALGDLEETRELAPAASQESRAEKELQTLLLFDNRTQERFAFPLELISRIEQVSASRIERIKDHQFLQYQDKKLKLIFLEDYLPVSRPERSPEDTIGIIVPKQLKHPMGIVFHQVINTVETVVELDTQTIMGPGLFGTAVINERITLLPDMYRLFELAAPEWYQTEPVVNRQDPARKYRVLLADDTPFFRMVETEYLQSAGYEVLEAEDGRKTLGILETEPVDAVILDIVMPHMDGWETIRAIREDERLRDLPVMAVTSLSDENLAQQGIDAGFTQWESKLNKTRLLEKLAAMLKPSGRGSEGKGSG